MPARERDDDQAEPAGRRRLRARRPACRCYANAGSAFGAAVEPGGRRRASPRRARQFELGVKKTLPRAARRFLTAAAYHLEKENIAIPDATGVTRQTGDQRSRGFELELPAEAQPRLVRDRVATPTPTRS